MPRFALVCLLTVLLGSGAARVWAGDEILNYVSIGRGLDTCTVMATASDERYPRVIHWLAGYLTSYNRWQPDTYDITGDPHASDWETWMQQYCMRYPTLPIARAAEAFVHAFYASRLTQAPHEGLPPAPQPTPPPRWQAPRTRNAAAPLCGMPASVVLSTPAASRHERLRHAPAYRQAAGLRAEIPYGTLGGDRAIAPGGCRVPDPR